MELYDIAIVGSGPAGLSAAINAKIRNKNIILFGQKDLSSKIIKAPKINNYLGFYNITGIEMKNSFLNHIKNLDINIVEEKINDIYDMGEYFALMVNEKMYKSKSVILATGIEYTKPILGENEFLGKGLGYCATCDAPLYKGKIVTIVSYNKNFEKDANYVKELAEKVYYIPMYSEEVNINENIEVIYGKPKEVVGSKKVEKLILENNEIITDGIFFLRDSISPAQLVPGLVVENGHINVDREMKTNLKGCFAAGDCVGKPYQYIKAAGEGQVAALNAVSFLDKKK